MSPSRPSAQPARLLAVGDPQTSLARFLAVLRHAGILDDQDRLAPDQALISLGDHFDYPPGPGSTVREAGEQGRQILAWLAAQDPRRCRILLGNHDACRVMELIRYDDAEFQLAQHLARQPGPIDFAERFPELPTSSCALRDFSCFSEAQRTLVQELLLTGRMQLAQAARLPDGRPILLTHAGVSGRELELLGMPDERDPLRIAQALDAFLARRVAAVRPAWQQGEAVPLDLSPLHITGRAGSEGGGLLYHRPATQIDRWGAEPSSPRRFHLDRLPRGLLQACGHTPPKKLRELMPTLAASSQVRPGALQCLIRTPEPLRLVPASATRTATTALWLVDGGMSRNPIADIESLELAGWLD